MKASWFPAPSHLGSVLSGIWALESAAEKPLSAQILPDGTPYIVFQRSGTRLVSSDNDGQQWSTCSVSGPRSRKFEVELAPAGKIFVVQLSSSGGLPVLGLPMSQLVDRCEELENVIESRSDAGILPDQMMNQSDDASCINLLESWVGKRMAASRGNRVGELVTAIRGELGRTSISKLAKQANLSERHLNRLMQQEVGLSPKQFARIIRFDHAVQLGRMRPRISLPQIAQLAGYADQAHMTREFVQIGGIRPGDIQREIGAMIW